MTPTNPSSPSSPIEQTDKVLKQFLKDSDGTVENPRGEALARISAIVVESIGEDEKKTDPDYYYKDAQTQRLILARDALRAQLRQQWSNPQETK